MASIDKTAASPTRPRQRAARGIAAPLWVLTLLFASRVSGQALQWLAPRAWLPAFGQFQGSALPYWLLLPMQILILATMAVVTVQVQRGTLVPSGRASRALGWAGGAYMAVALGRIAVGLCIPPAPDWFRAWIPGAFHVVLAGFVLTLGVFHRSAPKADHAQE
jgi:hypothetical protein